MYRALAELAGCRLWTDGGVTLWADRRVMGVFTLEQLQGQLRFPRTGTYREVISGKVYRNVSEISLDTLQTNGAVFIAEDPS